MFKTLVKRTGIAIGFYFAVSLGVVAGELPDSWQGRSSNEFGSMRFFCTDSTKVVGRKNCKFSYEVLKLNEPFSKQQVEIEQELKKGEEWRKFHDDMCLESKQKSRAVFFKEQEIKLKKRNYNEPQLRMMRELFAEIFDACKEKSYASTLQIMKVIAKVNDKTCYTRRWAKTLEFSEIRQGAGKRSIWLNEGQPNGSCGLKEVVKIIPSETSDWVVSFEYVVLNLDGVDDERRSCIRYQTLKHRINSDLVSEWGLPCSVIKLNSQYLDPEFVTAPFPK